MEEVSMQLFRRLFGPDLVRAQCDWDRLVIKCKARLEVVVGSAVVLESVYLPWYTNASGALVQYDAPDARPLTPHKAAEALGVMSARRQAFVRESLAYFGSNKGVLQLTIPAYCVGRGRRAALDGSHRLTALAIAKPREVRFLFFMLTGPIDPMLVADLTYWQRESM
jgi:hypothetical protein